MHVGGGQLPCTTKNKTTANILSNDDHSLCFLFYWSMFYWYVYLVRRQKAEHALGHHLADMEQQRAHLVLESIRFSMLEGGTEFSALGSCTNSAYPNLRREC